MTLRLPLTFATLLGATIVAGAAPQEPSISVLKSGGAFVVAAHFNVPAPPSVVRDVLARVSVAAAINLPSRPRR